MTDPESCRGGVTADSCLKAVAGRSELYAKIRDINISTPDERLLERVLRVINEHLDDPRLTVEQVAAEVGISRVHLHRKLKELTGQSPRDFIRNLRLDKAAQMLADKKYAISELADAVGFQSASSFTSAFKTHYGVNPSEYNRQ